MQLRPYIAIDLGSDSTRAKGPVGNFSCPSQTVQLAGTETVTAVGKAASEKTISDEEVRIRPVQSGVIVDRAGARALLANALSSVSAWWTIFRPVVILVRSQLASKAETKQLQQAARNAGAYSVYTANACALAALGSGVDPHSSKTHLVIDCGAGSCEAAAVVRGNPTATRSVSVGGFDLIDQICQYVNGHCQGVISRSQGRRILEQVGSALPKDSPGSISVSVSDGDTVTVTTNQVVEIIAPQLQSITETIQALMRRLPAALLADIGETGVLLSGGLARLNNFSEYLRRRLSVPVTVTERPREAAVSGAWKARSFIPDYQRHVQYSSSYNYFH